MTTFKVQELNPGSASGRVIALEESLSFWGGFDPVSGRVIDRNHPQCGTKLSGKILVMPSSRGSAGTPAGVAESLRRGQGPLGIVLEGIDVNVAIGAMIADRLYDLATPVVVASGADYSRLTPELAVEIKSGGELVIGTM